MGKYIRELNESIKDYHEKILINTHEYREPYQVIVKDGKDTVAEGKFLEINKANELFKKGKQTTGTIIDIIDDRDFNINTDMLEGDVFLIVEFINDNGKKYKVKTPAISKDLYNYIRVGQKVDVYYDDTVKREAIYNFAYVNGKREKVFYDNIDFYVTNIKGKIVSYKPIILKLLAILFMLAILCFIVYSFFIAS